MTDATTTDEEEQITPAVLSARLEELQNEVCRMNDKTKLDIQVTNDNLEQEKQSNAANYEILQKGIRDLQTKMQKELDEAKAEMQSDIADLQQQLHNQALTTTTASSLRATQPNNGTVSYANRSLASLFHGRNTTSHADGLPSDTFTLMMTSPIVSKAWLFAIITFALQMILTIMIASDQMKESQMSSLFNVPFKVDTTVRVGQFFTIIFALATRHDITDSVRFIIMFWNDPHWDRTLLQRDQSAPQPTTAEWLVHVIVPNGIKFLQDILVIVITLVVIVQSDNIIDLLKDFTALMVLSETDNIFFGLAANGYAGSELQRKAEEVKGIRIQSEEASSSGISSSYSNSNRNINQAASLSHSASVSQKDFLLRPIILVVIGVLMISFWLLIVFNQVSGKYFRKRYPKCNFTGAFEDAREHFGDSVCYGGRLNTLECAFEGGDCVNFNLAHPLCKGDDLVNVEEEIGNGKCNQTFNNRECNFDGNDCTFESRYPNCTHIELAKEHFGNGICYGGPLNTLECAFEGGDCINFNLAYPLCKGDDLVDAEKKVGNGYCDVEFNTPECSFDGNDCAFETRYPDCPHVELAKEHFGNGICYGGPLNTLECKFEDGDCINFNLAFPLCRGDDRTDVQNRVGNGKCEKAFMSSECDYDGGDCCPYEIIDDPLFGDGQCHGGIYSTESCGYDDKDCDEFILRYPNCPLDDLSGILGAGDVVIGNGICDSGIYNLEDCGYEYGDCNRGQVGQTVFITDDIESTTLLYFSKSISMDGKTIALGMPVTSEDGNFDLGAPGLVRIWRFHNIKKQWLQLGSDIVGLRANDDFGCSMSLTSSGRRIAISSNYEVRVYDFNTTLVDKWSQVGQTIDSTFWYLNAVITSDGSRLALIHSSNEIRVYELQSDSNGNNDYHSINLSFSVSHRTEMKFNALDGSTLLVNEASNVVKIFRFKSDADSKPSWIQKGTNYFRNPRISTTESPTSTAISGDGNRIAMAFNSTHDDAPGRVYVYDFYAEKNEWIFVSRLIKSSFSSDGDGFGYGINMSSDGNLLVIASNNPKCQIRFDIDDCTTGSIEVYNYHPQSNQFNKVPPNSASPYKANGNILDLADLSDVGIFGFHFSMNGDGSVLSISGYNDDDGITFIEAYNLDELFYTKCVAHHPQYVGNGWCNDYPPYNSTECGFDGGDCVGLGDRKPVEGYPRCFVYFPTEIFYDKCYDVPPYNSEECGFDGGDCDRKPVEGYSNCLVHNTNWINDGACHDWPPYNTEECGFDGGDCL